MSRKALSLGFLAVVLCLAHAPPAQAQESASFRMERVTVAGGATTASSANFDNSVTTTQVGLVGSASFCNAGFVDSLGFWSVLGDVATPIRLDVRLNEPSPPDVDLFWAGSADEFQVFRAFDAADVLNPNSLFLETTNCDAQDAMHSAATVIFYFVQPKP